MKALRKVLFAAIVALTATQALPAFSQTELQPVGSDGGKRHVVRCNADGSWDCSDGCQIGSTCC
jgi:hypothetical protein